MLECLQDIINYLDENVSDPVPRYILEKEIKRNSQSEYEHNKLKESKWYKQLAAEQWENGSWGRFHTQDTRSQSKQKFCTTESAISRARELSLDKDDEIIYKAIQLMERYIRDEEEWLDTSEQHYGFQITFRTLVAANLSLFDPKHPLVLTKKKYVLITFQKLLSMACLMKLSGIQKIGKAMKYY